MARDVALAVENGHEHVFISKTWSLRPRVPSGQTFQSGGPALLQHMSIARFRRSAAAFLALTLLLLATGCVNGFSKFYVPNPRLAATARFFQPYSGTTEVYQSGDMKGDAERLVQRGYSLLGTSDFHGAGKVTREQLLAQAKEVGADIVLSASAFQGTREVAVPIVNYTPGAVATTTSNGTVNANAYASNGASAYGTATYHGYSTTRTSGTVNTQFVPMTVESYSYDASFWRKSIPPTLGVYGNPLPSEMRQALQRNAGVLITIVVDGSPAFRANILVGDVLVGLGGETVESPPQLTDLLDEHGGELVEVTVLRGSTPMKFQVQLNPRPPKT